MKKRLLAIVSAVVILLSALSFTAFADMGPKPGVHIELISLGNEICYGTLLSKYETNGPNRAYEEGDAIPDYLIDSYTSADWQAREAFIGYEDKDGFYYLQEQWLCNEKGGFSWTYYPPDPFKILLYFPESGSFAVSEIYEQYAFDSYYTVNLGDLKLTENYHNSIFAAQSYDHSKEVISLTVRIIATIAIELVLAVIFGLRKKNVFAFVSGVNVATQLALNLILFFVDYKHGSMTFTAYYIMLEILVFAAEAVIYLFGFKKLDFKQKKIKTVLYALVANTVSFGAGLGLAHLIPGIF